MLLLCGKVNKSKLFIISLIFNVLIGVINLGFNIVIGKADDVGHGHENQKIHVQVVGDLLIVVLHRKDAVHWDSEFMTALFHLRERGTAELTFEVHILSF